MTKRDTRSFTSEPVSDQDLDKVLQAGRMLAAQALGLASCSVTFHHEDCVRELLGFPADHRAPMGVGIGHPALPEEKKESAPRIPLDELVDRGRWR